MSARAWRSLPIINAWNRALSSGSLTFQCADPTATSTELNARWRNKRAASTSFPWLFTIARPPSLVITNATVKCNPPAAVMAKSTAICARCAAKTAGNVKHEIKPIFIIFLILFCFSAQEIRVRGADGPLPGPGRFPLHWLQSHLSYRVRSRLRDGSQNLFQRMFSSTGELSLSIFSRQKVSRKMRRARRRTQGLYLLNWTYTERLKRSFPFDDRHAFSDFSFFILPVWVFVMQSGHATIAQLLTFYLPLSDDKGSFI